MTYNYLELKEPLEKISAAFDARENNGGPKRCQSVMVLALDFHARGVLDLLKDDPEYILNFLERDMECNEQLHRDDLAISTDNDRNDPSNPDAGLSFG